MNLSIYMPSPFLVKKLGLRLAPKCFDRWIDGGKSVVFLDPSVHSNGPGFALANREILDEMITKEQMALVWLIGGVKNLFRQNGEGLHSEMVFNSMIWTLGDGEIHYLKNATRG
jgi:hypothetical protein